MKTTPIILSLITNGHEEKQEASMTTENRVQKCDAIIYIDGTTFITPLDFDNWKITNEDFIILPLDFNPLFIRIDVNKIPQPDFPKWLVDNQDHISYELTSDYIEFAHRITDTDVLTDIDHTQEHSRLKLKDLKKQVTDQHGDFDNYKYEKYVSFQPNGDQMSLTLMNFELEMSCFSFPLLRIVSKGMDDESEFVFKLMDFQYSNKKLAVVFAIELNNVISDYYDFSHIPTVIPFKEYTAI